VARKRTLKLGFTAGDTVEVIEGLNEGDLVVIIGQEGLREGLPIRIPGRSFTEAPAGTSAARGQPRGTRMASKQHGAPRPGVESGKPEPHETTNGETTEVDPREVERIEKAMMKNPFVKRMFERELETDPSLADDPAKKMAFFRRVVQRFEERAMQMPAIQEEFEKRLQEDPELEQDLVKKMEFFREMFRKMRGRR